MEKFVRSRGLKIFHQNVRGCLGKIEQLRLLMDKTRKEIQIFGVTETHLNGDITDEEASSPGYRLERLVGALLFTFVMICSHRGSTILKSIELNACGLSS